MKGNDFRAERTKRMIIDSYLAEVEKNGSDGVRVTDICANIHISRKTFYSYFETKDGLKEYLITLMVESLNFDSINKIYNAHKQISYKDYMKVFEEGFKKILQHRTEYIIMFNDKSNHEFEYKFSKYMKEQLTAMFSSRNCEDMGDVPLEIQIESFSAVGTILVKWWLNHPYEPTDKMAKYTVSILSDSLMRNLWPVNFPR